MHTAPADIEEMTKSNVTHRDKAMRDAHKELSTIEADIAELREQASEIKARLKKDFDVVLADFAQVRRWWLMEKDKRDAKFSNYQDYADALQLDLFK